MTTDGLSGFPLEWARDLVDVALREDFPDRDDERFLHHIHLRRSADGALTAELVPVPRSNLDGLDLDHTAAERAVAQNDSRMEGRR